ncbi:uncharacterized protein NECHADRAFT_79450 [Fusarium vanettenii 77-13-4]|uniref:Uncharacterized protein n=1 Tax=Fusarium vanettenii (strain ATCC MYA-4622 / CBS 123669 / FGSC 9596 / NRRL 45880 / 77-13-4) TaxID=660122 RepID=C7YNW7_FUSV7|nr:uncharacterized protein NECHADRAFT_79450 [Fusarium vanettenii 77-13-4]EEU46188.1 predicted protein [Fusarium vanettenii 77-13-4]
MSEWRSSKVEWTSNVDKAPGQSRARPKETTGRVGRAPGPEPRGRLALKWYPRCTWISFTCASSPRPPPPHTACATRCSMPGWAAVCVTVRTLDALLAHASPGLYYSASAPSVAGLCGDPSSSRSRLRRWPHGLASIRRWTAARSIRVCSSLIPSAFLFLLLLLLAARLLWHCTICTAHGLVERNRVDQAPPKGGKLLALADGLGQVHFALELFYEGRSSARIIGRILISGALELEGQPRTKSRGSSREGQFKLKEDLTIKANQPSDSFVDGVSLSIQTRKRDTLPNAQRSTNKAPQSLARVQTPRSERKV